MYTNICLYCTYVDICIHMYFSLNSHYLWPTLASERTKHLPLADPCHEKNMHISLAESCHERTKHLSLANPCHERNKHQYVWQPLTVKDRMPISGMKGA